MSDSPLDRLPSSKSRTAWWFVVGALAAAVGLFVYSFVGTFVLGLFVYYGVRPLHDRLAARLDSRSLSATVTMLAVVLPVLALLTYAGAMALQEVTKLAGPDLVAVLEQRLPVSVDSLATLTRRPLATFRAQGVSVGSLQRSLKTVLGMLTFLGTGLLHLTLALSFAFFLLRDGPRLATWFRADVRGEGSPVYTYLKAVDDDLETVYFGNVLTVLLVTVAAVLLYNGFAFVMPQSITLPAPTLLAILTGLATFVPLVVGKLVYVPVTVYLAAQAVNSGVGLWVPVAFLAACFLALDLFPQTVLRPLVSGRSLHSGLVLFAYVLGAALFGWYGLFLGPLIAVLAVQAAKLILPELTHGDPVTSASSDALDIGADLSDDAAERAERPDSDVPDDGDAAASDDERTTGTDG